MKPIHNPTKIAALPKKAAKISTKQSPVNNTPENSQKQPADKPQTTPSQPSWEPGHHPGGRPRKFTDPDAIAKAGDEFFKSCDEKKIPYTITGLALELGFCSRQMLLEYEATGEFGNAIKRLKARCERYAEERMYGNNAAGPIFALKNYGWMDRQDVNVSGDAISDALERLAGGKR
jgi:hypothetical protein